VRRTLFFCAAIVAAVFCCAGESHAVTASTPSCSYTATQFGDGQEACNNPNANTPTIMCGRTDNGTPVSNGSGTGCVSPAFALSPVASGGSEYTGYLSLGKSATLTIVAGVNGESDSAVATYSVAVATPTVLASHFGMQCGPSSLNCGPPVGGVLSFPSSIAAPNVVRIHDAGQGWSQIEPSCAAFSGSLCTQPNFSWTTFDEELDMIANHNRIGELQMLSTPCWLQDPCNVADPVYPNGGTAPPTDLGSGPMGSSPNFNAFITALVNHVSANGNPVATWIKIFQMWNEYDLCEHWTGTASQLYAMLYYPVTQIIRPAIAGVRITTPSVQFEGSNCQINYYTDLATWLNLENTNGRFSDWPDVHAYLTLTNSTTNTPETQWSTYVANYLSTIAGIEGWSVSPWIDSETNFDAGDGYVCPSSQYTEADCAGQLVRWQILHESNGAIGLDIYYWEDTIGQPAGSTASGYYGFSTPYYTEQQLMIGAHFTAAAALLSGSTWTAPLVEANGTTALFVWSPCSSGGSYNTCVAGTSYTVPAKYTDYKTITGGITAVTAGQSITIGVQPIMLEQAVSAMPSAGMGELIPGVR
jgi:hypothetical protein